MLLNNTNFIVAIYYKKDSPCCDQFACQGWSAIRDFRINASRGLRMLPFVYSLEIEFSKRCTVRRCDISQGNSSH